MLTLLADNWWVLPVIAVTTFFAIRMWARQRFGSQVNAILQSAQQDFSVGSIEVHALRFDSVQTVDGEPAMVYTIDATICPSDEQVEWAPADLFLRGVDEDGDENPMEMGEVRSAKHWNGQSFDSIKRNKSLVGEQRVELKLRFSGEPSRARFNYKFACFGSIMELPPAAKELATAE